MNTTASRLINHETDNKSMQHLTEKEQFNETGNRVLDRAVNQ